jgi:ABC-type transport system involved in cytochrome c biogenesis permease component
VTFLPILRRELAVAARRTATYRQRVIFAGLAVATLMVFFAFLQTTRFTGANIFHIISWGGFILCALEGLRATADSIAFERREGTLGLLLLTDLNGREVVIGKLAAATVQTLTTVVAMLPTFTLPVLLGGVTAGECWRVMLAFVAMLFFTLTAGTLVSSFVTNPLTAFITTAMLVMAMTLPPIALTYLPGTVSPQNFVWLGGPVEMFLNVPDSSFSVNPAIFWRSTIVCGSLCAAMFVAACFLLERFPNLEVKHTESWWQRWLRPRVGRAESWGGATSRTSPAAWLAERTLPGQRVLWILIGVGAVTCFLVGCFAGRRAVSIILICEVFFGYLIKLWLAAVAPQSINSSRRSGALELLLCTPMSPPDLVRGQVDALYGYFIGPALVTAIGFTIAGITGIGVGQNFGKMSPDSSPLIFGIVWLISFLLDMHALAYMGLWFGLTNARLDRAIAKTVFTVLILPWITLVVPIVGCIGVIGWPLFWINWASRRLNRRFREETATLFSPEGERSGWLPWSRVKD